VKRGQIWTVAGGPDYAGKPRPVLIVQDNRYDVTESITVCGLTSIRPEAPISRPEVLPTAANGLREPSRLMVDKITTVRKKNLGRLIGVLEGEDVTRLNRAIAVFLGLAGS
jgi:mRNA interferase MazF